MKNQIWLSLIGLFITSFSTTYAIAQNQQNVRCVLGGSSITGMVMHIDPATGRPISRPLPEQAADLASLRAVRANRSTEGLVQEVGPTGGIRVNLRNRFRSPLVAMVKKDGSVHADHLSCMPEASEANNVRAGN